MVKCKRCGRHIKQKYADETGYCYRCYKYLQRKDQIDNTLKTEGFKMANITGKKDAKFSKDEYQNQLGLFSFIMGVMGVILTIGTFLSFFQLIFLGGVTTGSLLVAFIVPVLLMILGASMVYWGFFHKKNNKKIKDNHHLITLFMWGIIYSLAILLANYILSKFSLTNTLLIITITSIIISIVVQITKGHKSQFHINSSTFYFFIYSIILWIVWEFIIPNLTFQTNFLSSILTGFIISGVIAIVHSLNIKRDSIKWISFILFLILIVSNLGSFNIPNEFVTLNTNQSSAHQSSQSCPLPLEGTFSRPLSSVAITPSGIDSVLSKMLDQDVWQIESNLRTCYQGRHKGQYPNWMYCDDMVVSRWETSNSGTIEFRWYTALTAEYKPLENSTRQYIFDKFSCENGQRVTVNKEKTDYYVHVSRDGTEIKIEY